MKRLTYWQIGMVVAFLSLYTVLSFTLPKGPVLTAVSDISGAGLWVIALVVMVRAAYSNQGQSRWFWSLMTFSAVMVGTNLGAWLFYEVILGRPTPDPFWADIPLFLQPVPMMAAAAMRPGFQQREQKFYLSSLNFLILLMWWVYIYAFLVFPNEFVLMNRLVFNTYYYLLYVVEFSVLLAVIGGMALVTEGVWRRIYWELFWANALYLIAFQWLNAALGREEYYSGSFYDVPNYAAVCWFILIAVRARNVPSEQLAARRREREADVSGLLAVLAVLSMPVIGLFEQYFDPFAAQQRTYRVTVTLISILFVAVCVFLRQMLLAREMKRLLKESTENLEQLQRAQGQLIQKERLAGIGQLVSGVAHELNNPLTAVMGYSDLLKERADEGDARQKLERLGSEARRMKKIIDNLISFARPPREEGRRPLDIATVVRDSLMLCEYQWKSLGITFELHFAPDLPRIPIDEGQFKQVFVNLFSNAAQAVAQSREKRILVEGTAEGGKVVVRFSDSGPGFNDLSRAFDPFYTTRPIGQGTGLGLSMCYGTVKEHNGNMYVRNLEPSGASVTIELPAA